MEVRTGLRRELQARDAAGSRRDLAAPAGAPPRAARCAAFSSRSSSPPPPRAGSIQALLAQHCRTSTRRRLHHRNATPLRKDASCQFIDFGKSSDRCNADLKKCKCYTVHHACQSQVETANYQIYKKSLTTSDPAPYDKGNTKCRTPKQWKDWEEAKGEP